MAYDFKELERLRDRARRNEASALRAERVKIAKKMKARGDDINAIAEMTELTVDEVLRLK